MENFEGKVAVVTGGASGIGLALARRFATEGARVVIGDIEKDALDVAVAELEANGTETLGVVTDVSDAAQVQALADAAVARFGAVHVLCNNAGIGAGGLSWEVPLSTWEWIIGVNLMSVVHGIRSFVPILAAQDEAHIVNTASVAGLVSAPFMAPYSATKHAVVSISETLFHELPMSAPSVGVSVLCPGWVRTRIADSARNRPEHLREEGAADMAETLRPVIEAGMPPEEVAGKVIDAVRAGRFWILPHDGVDDDFWMNAVNGRVQALKDRANPRF